MRCCFDLLKKLYQLSALLWDIRDFIIIRVWHFFLSGEEDSKGILIVRLKHLTIFLLILEDFVISSSL